MLGKTGYYIVMLSIVGTLYGACVNTIVSFSCSQHLRRSSASICLLACHGVNGVRQDRLLSVHRCDHSNHLPACLHHYRHHGLCPVADLIEESKVWGVPSPSLFSQLVFMSVTGMICLFLSLILLFVYSLPFSSRPS